MVTAAYLDGDKIFALGPRPQRSVADVKHLLRFLLGYELVSIRGVAAFSRLLGRCRCNRARLHGHSEAKECLHTLRRDDELHVAVVLLNGIKETVSQK